MRADRIQVLARDEGLARRAGFVWGFAEGVFFFIVPDVYVTFAALYGLRAGAVAWAASIAGSLVAVGVIVVLAGILAVDYLRVLPYVPGISAGMIAAVDRTLRAGLPYDLWLITGGIPLKVYAGVAVSQGTGLVALLIWTVFARIVRIAPTYALVAAVRLLFRRSIDARPAVWFGVFVFIWVAFYTFYFMAMSRRLWV